MEVSKTAERLAESSCILEVHVRQPSFRKKVNSYSFLSRSGNALGISGDVISIGKDLLEKSDIRYLEQLRNEFLRDIKAFSVSGTSLTLGNGQYLMPVASCEDIKDRITRFQIERNELLNRFEREYPSLIEKARGKLGGLFVESEYPPFESIRLAYRIEYQFKSNSLPAAMAKVSQRVMKEEEAHHKRILEQAVAEIRASMSLAFQELLDDLILKLGKNPETGKFSSLPESRIRQLQAFINGFEARNLARDPNLSKLVKQAKDVMGNSTIREVKSDENLREEMALKFAAIKKDTDEQVKSVTRQIDTNFLDS